MKLRSVIRTITVMSIALLCVGFGAYSYFRLSAVDSKKDFNLYALVPNDVIAVFETDRVAELMEGIDQLECSRDSHFLYISDLLVYLKDHLHTLLEETPHGFSKQMSKVLISFHAPDTPQNQVLYCNLGLGDYELVESFIKKYSSTTFPSKSFDYKGEEISIYSMPDGRFFAVYLTSDFLAISFQKRLIEQAIDAWIDNSSLLDLPSFQAVHAEKKMNVEATVYARIKAVDMGKKDDNVSTKLNLGSWAEFELKLNEKAIYCSGVSHSLDTMQVFMTALKSQKPLERFSEDLLPASTFFYDCWAVSDIESLFRFATQQKYVTEIYPETIKKQDEEWLDFLKRYAEEQVLSCLFTAKDTLRVDPCAVTVIPIKNTQEAERYLRSLPLVVPRKSNELPLLYMDAGYQFYPLARGHRFYKLSRNTLLAQLTGITASSLYMYACFYRNYLLVAPDAISLSGYIDAIKREDLLEDTFMYKELVGKLSSAYNFVMMADLEEIFVRPANYVRLIPTFFFRHSTFFQHFVLAAQFTCVEGAVYPNLVFLYKSLD